MTTLQKKVDALRSRMVKLRAERGGLNLCSNSRAEVVHAIDQTIAAWSIEAETRLGVETKRAHVGHSFSPFRINASPGLVDLGPVLVAAIGAEAMRARLMKNADALPIGMPKADREARIAEIDAELLAIGREEEQLIMQSEDEDAPIARRWDADPAIVLQP